MLDFEVYIVDTETTGLDFYKNDVVELSIYRLSSDQQKTWFLKPSSPDNIEDEALKINGHKKEDLLHLTRDGREKYKAPDSTLVEIENWINEDLKMSQDRLLVGQNISFDKYFLEFLWKKNNCFDSFPFGRRMLDTQQVALWFDIIMNHKRKAYNLLSLAKDFDVKIEKAHRADADTRMTKDLLIEQLKTFQELIKK